MEIYDKKEHKQKNWADKSLCKGIKSPTFVSKYSYRNLFSRKMWKCGKLRLKLESQITLKQEQDYQT